ncbi:hypothetical protein [Fusobacterium polymorphum]
MVYVGKEKSPYTGIVEEYYPNGVLEVRYNLKNGQLESEAIYKNGQQVK